MSQTISNRAESQQKLITEGSIYKTFFTLASPAIATSSLQFILSFMNMIWVGRIGGPVPVAIVISCMFSLWIVWSLISTLSTGVVAVLSRHFGARDFESSSYVASQALGFAVCAGALISIVGFILAPVAFQIMETSSAVTAGGIIYLRILFAGSFFIIFIDVMNSIFRAVGDTKTPMMVSFIAIGVNLILDPLLIFGVGPFPKLGTAGAATASVIACAVATLTFIVFLRKGRLSIPLSHSIARRPDLSLAWRMIKIGVPMSISGILFSLVYFLINSIASHYGDQTVAAMGIGNRCESISYLICFGASVATATMVGQNLGAQKPERAEKSAWIALLYTCGFTAIITILFLTIPGIITKMFLNDVEVESIVKNYLLIIGLSQMFMAMEIVMEGAFSGAGDTLPPMLVSVVWSLARIPLAYLFCFTFNMGSKGIWWAISSTSIIKGIIMVIWFKQGKWKLKKV